MTTKSEIDRMLETLESFRAIVPAHVRQLLRMLAERCDELEASLDKQVDDTQQAILAMPAKKPARKASLTCV